MKPRLASAERRQSIIDAAIPLFARKGFTGTTTREIAEAAGVSEALVFKLFASKTALYDAIFESCGDVSPAFERIQQLVPSTSALIELVELVAGHFARLPEAGKQYEWNQRLFLRSLLEDGEFARVGFRTFEDALMPLFAECLETARRSGDLVDGAPEAGPAFWFMAQTPLMLGALSLTETMRCMNGFSYREIVQGILRGIGLREDVIARHAEPVTVLPRATAVVAAMG